jgi:endonuclease/exonuclease/phosphatase family metal-dependent hydrolase
MKGFGSSALLVALLFGGWYFLTNYDVDGLDALSVEPKQAASGDGSQPVGQDGDPGSIPVVPGKKTIRIATVNLGPFDRQKLDTPRVAASLVKIARQFDVLAIQDVRAANQTLLADFVAKIAADGGYYDFVVPPEVGRTPVEQYTAILFDRAAVAVDRTTVYTVEDDKGRIRRPPLVASFQARGPGGNEAFTFTLINVHVDASQSAVELDLLDDAYRAVRDSGRGEDDVIVLGDFNADPRHAGQLAQLPNATWAVNDKPTTTRGTRLVGNILFDGRASMEFTGRSGTFDLMRELNLTMREAVEVSDHLPVWAEFSIFEGGEAARLASQTVTTR